MSLSARQLEILRALAVRAPLERSGADEGDWSDLERRGLIKVRSSNAKDASNEITDKGHAALDVFGGIKTVGTRPNRPK